MRITNLIESVVSIISYQWRKLSLGIGDTTRHFYPLSLDSEMNVIFTSGTYNTLRLIQGRYGFI